MLVIPALLFSTAAVSGSGGGGGGADSGATSLDAEPAGAIAPPKAVAAIPTGRACAPGAGVDPAPAPTARPAKETGMATWYDTFDGTCAHVSLPMGTVVIVTNTATGKSTTCRVADRGPFGEGRVIDLDVAIFAELADPSAGIVPVQLRW